MKKALILSLVLLLVATMATTAYAEEKPNAEIRGSYTIDDGLVYYEIQLLGDQLCYLSFTIQSELEIVEILTDDTAFQHTVFEGNKVIAYSLGNIIADNSLVITVVLEVPNPGQVYDFHLTEVEAYNFAEEALEVSIACPMIEVHQEASAAEPTPTEPMPSETESTKPASSEPLPSDPETEVTVSSPSTETHPTDTGEKLGAPKHYNMNIYTLLGFCFLIAGIVIALVLKFL